MHVTPVACAGINWHLGEVGSQQLRGFQRLIHVVDGQYKGAGLAGLRRLKDCEAARIAEIAFVAELVHEMNLIGIVIKRCEGNSLRGQDTSNDLPDTSKTGDDDMIVFRGELVVGRFARGEALADKAVEAEQNRRRCHRKRDNNAKR